MQGIIDMLKLPNYPSVKGKRLFKFGQYTQKGLCLGSFAYICICPAALPNLNQVTLHCTRIFGRRGLGVILLHFYGHLISSSIYERFIMTSTHNKSDKFTG